MAFFDQLLQASFGGVPFGVLSGEARFGRRQAIHEYPFRDKPWVEDLGRSARRVNVTGFLIENDAIYGGGDVLSQRDSIVAAAESPGTSTLIHPTLGRLDVSLFDIEIREKWDHGRYFEIRFSFIETGQLILPDINVATGSAVIGSALASDLAAAGDFVLRIVKAIHQGEAIIHTAINTANMWIAIAKNVANDATNLYGMVTSLPGQFGRFFGGASAGFMASAQPAAAQPPTIASLINAGSISRATVATAADTLAAAVAAGVPADMATSAQALSAAVLGATVDPADGLRLLASLGVFTPNAYTTSSVIGQAMATVQTSLGNLFRRAAIVSLARASSTYQPSSANDAIAVRNSVTALLDSEIEIAGDNGEDSTYGALRALRQSVVTDLNTRGAALPAIKTFSFQASLPAAALSLRLYRDASRADEIASETDAPHPAFQPFTIQVLAQ